MTAKRAPGSPAGAGVGWSLGAGRTGDGPCTHPAGPVSPTPWTFPGAGPSQTRLWANKGEISVNFTET